MASRDTVADGAVRARPRTHGWRRFAELIWATAVFDYKKRYAETVLGLVWGILEPIIYSFVLYLVFTRALRFGGTIENYVAMLILNVTLFQAFRHGTRNAMRSLVSRKAMVKSMRVPRIVLVLAGVFSAGLVLATSLPVAFAWIFGYSVEVTITWLLFPVILLYLLFVTIVVGMVLAALFARWRDTGVIWGLYSRILFLTSGVIFPFEFIKGEEFRTIAAFNPICPAFVQTREWMIDRQAPNWIEASGGGIAVFAPFIVLAGIVLIALLFFNRLTRRAAEAV
jgi:lipopolysaccharide transport system permease protein